MTETEASETIQELARAFPEITVSEFRKQTRVVVPREQLFDALKFLRDERNFTLLVDVTCVDYAAYRKNVPARFGLVYLLANPESNERLTARTFLSEDNLEIPSVVELWEGANWLEREAWDMFGIRFLGHPDLRRILLPEEFAAHPLRKDYPLQGRGERHNFPVVTRDES
ncbi:MAG: NADH-quinone oxidoreductase subunit C [Planctomycetales bacterium]